MSKWSYAKGVIEVTPYGRTQAECRYILETVLAHLPEVTGSEENMYTHLIQCGGYNISCSHNEFSEWVKDGWIEYQNSYMITIEGHFRDREFEETYRAFIKWLTRLAKRVWVNSCLVKISGNTENWEERTSIVDLGDLYDYLELYSWCGKGTVNWCEYLIWKEIKDRKGRRCEGKPDFSDGSCLSLMTEKEKRKRLWSKKN